MVSAGKGGVLLQGGDLVLPDRLVRDGAVLVEGAKIAYAGPAAGVPAARIESAHALERIDARGGLICPALVEPHIHGGGGHSFHNPTREGLQDMARFLSSRGTGIFLPTMVPDPRYLASAAAQIGRYQPASRIPGIYLEGPYIARARRGGIPEELVRPFSQEDLQRLWDAACGRIRVLTFAPEIPGSGRLLEALRRRGIVPAFGHSTACLRDLGPFEDAGEILVTHLFNAMTGVSHREPGLAHWALLRPELYTELNVDGIHVHGAAVELTLRLRPWNRMILISDAVVAAGLTEEELGPDQELYHGPNRAVLRGDGVYYRNEGTLIGSRRLIGDVVARVIGEHRVPVWEAVGMASLTPLRLLGFDRKGSLREGMDADISVFDRDFQRCTLQIFEGTVMHDAAAGS